MWCSGSCTRRRPQPGADSFLRIAAGGDGAQGWTLSCWGERPRPTGSLFDRRAVAHSGWGSQARSLSVDVVQRQRHAAPTTAGGGFRFANCGRRRWSSRMDLGLPGRAAATYGVAARSPGCCAPRLGVSGVLSIRRRGAAAAPRGADHSRGRIPICELRPAAMELKRWTLSGWGERPRPMGSPLDRRAVAHRGWGSQACSLSVDVVQRQRHAAPTTAGGGFLLRIAAGGDEAQGMDLEAAGASGRDVRGRCSIAGLCAHSGWGSQARSLSVDVGAAAAARGADHSRGRILFANCGRRRRCSQHTDPERTMMRR